LSNHKKEIEPSERRVGLRSLLALHRTLGLTSALFVILLSVTGLTLQHSSRFDLDASFLRAQAWLSWYKIEVPNITKSYIIDNGTVSLIADALYFNASLVSYSVPDIRGLVSLEDSYVAASPERLFLISGAGELIEVLGAVHGVPDQIEALAQGSQNSLLIRTSESVYQADLDNLEFNNLDLVNPQVSWNATAQVSQDIEARIKNNYGDLLVSWERLILDIHSGRIIGQWGVVLVDVMAILFLFMAVTGVWIWSRRRSSKQSR